MHLFLGGMHQIYPWSDLINFNAIMPVRNFSLCLLKLTPNSQNSAEELVTDPDALAVGSDKKTQKVWARKPLPCRSQPAYRPSSSPWALTLTLKYKDWINKLADPHVNIKLSGVVFALFNSRKNYLLCRDFNSEVSCSGY